MKTENHIRDILQLYEFAMAIGKSLDYKESCDLFLKLILKRKNFNAAWILEHSENEVASRYSIPAGKSIKLSYNEYIKSVLQEIEDFKLITYSEAISKLVPIDISTGYIGIFNLNDQGFLFVFSKKDNIKTRDLLQLQPVIDKFSIGLKACKAFEEQQFLLNDLEIQNQELSDYAHMVSHDLKSPLRSIDTLTAWLKEDYKDAFDAKGEHNLDLIRTNVEKMDTLIKGILEYSTIGKNRLEIYDVDLNNLISNIISILQVPNHINIIHNALPVIRGDKYRLQQLFQNLIDNAINYSDKTNGKIEIGAIDTDGYWEFYIKDNGKGIEEAYFNKIFKTFEKLNSDSKSTGIGLSIVKKIVNLYGGKIWLTSKFTEGTTFYFTLKKEPNGTT